MTHLTRNFKDTIKTRIELDPAFRDELLREGIECFLKGDVETGKSILRLSVRSKSASSPRPGLPGRPAEGGPIFFPVSRLREPLL